MLMLVHLFFVAMWAYSDAQPAACLDEEHCPSGFYCNREVHYCHECLHCASFKRQEPDVPTACVTSVVKCGPCFDGLEEPGDVTSACVPILERSGSADATPGYVWVVVGLGVPLLLMLVAGVVWWALRNTENFKIIASTRTSVRPACPAAPSAPERPPPYSAEYLPVRAVSPLPPYQPNIEESEDPFIKQSHWDGGDSSRESSSRQEANVYRPPRYVRPPPSTHSEPEERTVRDASPERFAAHDEDTMESVWTPAARDDNDTNNNNEASSSAPSVSADASAPARPPACPPARPPARPALRPLDLSLETPAKVLCVRQDSDERSPSPPPARRPRPALQQNIVINVTQNNFDAEVTPTHLR